MKKCFDCKQKRPLILFNKVPPGDYSREDWKGRVIVCKICNIKRDLKNRGIFRRGIDRKFTFIPKDFWGIVWYNIIRD